MIFVANANLAALLLGLLIGLIVALWIYKGRRGPAAGGGDASDETGAKETPLP